MPLGARVWVLAFVGFTAFVWVQRLVNLASGDESSIAVSLSLSVVLLVLAVGTAGGLVVVALRGWVAPPPVGVATLWRVAAAVTVGVWAVRATQIIVDWRSVAFVAVHVVLAAVSVILAVRLWQQASVRR